MHYPSHLRDRFCQWVGEGMPDKAIVELNYEVFEEPARDFVFRFLGCTDLMPRIERQHAADLLDLSETWDDGVEPWEGTYHAAAQAWLQRELNIPTDELAYEAFSRLNPTVTPDVDDSDVEDGVPIPPLLELHYQTVKDTRKTYLDRLSSVTSLRANIDSLERTLVAFARLDGISWEEIALRLQLSAAEAQALASGGGR